MARYDLPLVHLPPGFRAYGGSPGRNHWARAEAAERIQGHFDRIRAQAAVHRARGATRAASRDIELEFLAVGAP